MTANGFTVRDLFYDRLKVLPFNEVDGPNGSVMLFYQYNARVFIVQAFKQVGWECYVATKYTNIDNIFAELESL